MGARSVAPDTSSVSLGKPAVRAQRATKSTKKMPSAALAVFAFFVREGSRTVETRGCTLSEALPIGDELLDRVAAELLNDRVGEDERDHRLADDGGGRHGADVAALDGRGTFGHRREIDRAKRLHERRDRLHVRRHAEILAVGDA